MNTRRDDLIRANEDIFENFNESDLHKEVAEYDNYTLCAACSGSGEGRHSGSTCPICKGTGDQPKQAGKE